MLARPRKVGISREYTDKGNVADDAKNVRRRGRLVRTEVGFLVGGQRLLIETSRPTSVPFSQIPKQVTFGAGTLDLYTVGGGSVDDGGESKKKKNKKKARESDLPQTPILPGSPGARQGEAPHRSRFPERPGNAV